MGTVMVYVHRSASSNGFSFLSEAGRKTCSTENENGGVGSLKTEKVK